ncbi:hypothetical protein EDB19DRAFT_1963657 [Suillus lakei]|nr:hypothetical protein EDB19DRAFT_1963657 [Suillus lakei]
MAESNGEGHGFFVNNRLLKLWAGPDGFTLSSESDKASLLRTLKEFGSSFPQKFVSYRILPCLASALEFGGASAATIDPLILQFGKNIAPDDYGSIIVAPFVELFASADQGTRIALLNSLPDFAEKLDKKTVADKIWPNLLSDRILNNNNLRHLARLQSDPEASIRPHTCILIGRLGPSLRYNAKRKVLVPAISMGLRDSFDHARVAGVMAFMATPECFEMECFEMEDVARKVFSANIVGATLDKEKHMLIAANVQPETASTEEGEEDLPARLPGAFTQAGLVNSATDAASTLTG